MGTTPEAVVEEVERVLDAELDKLSASDRKEALEGLRDAIDRRLADE